MLRRPNSLRLGTSEGEELMLSYEKIGQLDSFIYRLIVLSIKRVDAVNMLKVE